MKRAALVVVGVLMAAVVAGLLLARAETAAQGSSLSKGATGWLGARLYLQARSVGTRLATDDSWPADGGVLVVSFPWQSDQADVGFQRLRRHLGAGGTLVVGYEPSTDPLLGEVLLLGDLGVGYQASEVELPLLPWRWLEAVREEVELEPAAGLEGAPPLAVTVPRWLPVPPANAEALYATADGRAAVWSWETGGGRVVLLPAELLSNARIASADHAGLLETLQGWLGGPWWFDEHHHGLTTSVARSSAAQRGFDLLLAQLALVYLAAALALGRRLGPPWRRSVFVGGSAGSFLVRIGRLHQLLGHASPAAALLLRRAAELDPRLALPPGDAPARVTDGRSLLELARAVGRLQSERSERRPS